MSIDVDDAKFHRIVLATLGKGLSLETYETRALIEIAQLAAWVDLEAPAEERALLQQLIMHICVHGGIDPMSVRPLSPLPIDEEERMSRIQSIADDLERDGVRELAYMIAWLLIVADLQLAKVETTLLDDLQRVLGIPQARAVEIADAVTLIVTQNAASNVTSPTTPTW